MIFVMILGTSWLTLAMFSPALAGGATNFAKKIQGLAEDKTENPRTCRGQSREQNPYERLQENSNPSKLCSSKLLSLSQPSLLQKPWAAVLPPGGLQLNPPAHLWWCYGRVKQILTEILLPCFSEGETTGPRIPPGRTPLAR